MNATDYRRREIANNVLNYFYGSEGFSAGSFGSALYHAASKADRANLWRLQEGFPEEIRMFRLAVEHPNGIETLREIAAVTS